MTRRHRLPPSRRARPPASRTARFVRRLLVLSLSAAPLAILAAPAQPAGADPVCGYVTVTVEGPTVTVPLVFSCTTCPFLSQGPNDGGAAGVYFAEYQCLNP